MLSKPIRAKAHEAQAEPVDAHGSDLDRDDIALLRELQQDARLSNAALAARIGLPAAPTWWRVKWLEQQGFITGYRAEIDRCKIGLGVLGSMDTLFKLPNVKDLHTSVSLGEAKAGAVLPLGHLCARVR